jgi:hypothetical protein
MTVVRSALLRTVIAADAVACGLMGAGFTFDASLLAGPLGLSPAVMQPVGLFLLVYAAGLAVLAARPVLPRRAVWVLVAFNLAWAVESLAAVALGLVQPTPLGVGFVVAQAAAAVVVADLQYVILRRSRRDASAAA